MTDPTRQDIINAYDSLEELKKAALKTAEFCDDTEHFLMCEHEILKALPPRPQPTMADIEWNNEKHYLAEAQHDVHGQVIMVGLSSDKLIEFFVPSLRDHKCDVDHPDTLTPTGHTFELKEKT